VWTKLWFSLLLLVSNNCYFWTTII
jgi:hypothetical protein